MYLFGLEGSGFILALGLILLMSGTIMFYCLRRFKMLENSIIEQGRVLQSFILRTQQEPHTSLLPKYVATDIAIKSAIEQTENMEDSLVIGNNMSKFDNIEVSDNDLESDESNSEYDSDESDESDGNESNSENKEGGGTLQNSELNELEDKSNKNINIEKIGSINLDNELSNVQELETVKVISINDLGQNLTPDIVNIAESDTSNSDTLSSIENSDTLDYIENSDSLNIIEVKQPTLENMKGLTKMKVSALRDLALEQGLVQNMDSANKIKKENLIKILQKK
jgi:hypothetical protein